MSTPLPYRPNVCMLLFNRKLKLWLGRRYESDIWQLPQGGVKKNVSLEENALRELEEELGVTRSDLGLPRRLKATHRYEWLNPSDHFRGKYGGQEQTFWVVPYLGKDSSIHPHDVEHPEFSEWRWIKAEELEGAVEEIRKIGYRGPLAEFIELRPGLLLDL